MNILTLIEEFDREQCQRFSFMKEWAEKAREWRREDEANGIVWAMRSDDRRSAVLRTEPVSRLRPDGGLPLSQGEEE